MLKNKILYRAAVLFTVIQCWMPANLQSQNSDSDNSASDWGSPEYESGQNSMVNEPVQSSQKPVQTEASDLRPEKGHLNVGTTEPTDYVIKKGDCLWNIAFQFFGNPFIWPRIWQNNSYIKNPDLIYPGEILKMSGSAGSENSESGSVGTSWSESLLTSKTGELLKNANLQKKKLTDALGENSTDSMLLSIIRSKDQLGGGFFASVPFLWFERNSSGVLLPGESVVDPPGDRAMYQLFDKILISIKKGESFKVGDSLDIYNYFRVIVYNNARATILKCVGSAHVVEIKKGKAFALLYKAYDKVLGGEHILKAANIKSQEIDTLVVPDVTIQGAVITRAEETESPYVFQTLIIDKGSEDGVRIGDIFAVYHNSEKGLTNEVTVVGCIANVKKNSSSMTIIKMSDNKISTSDRALLIRRTVFKGGGEN